MRLEIVAADRRFEVRRAATAWRQAGEIEPETEKRIAALYPDDRVRTTRVFRALFFVFTWFGFTTAYGLGAAFVMSATSGWERMEGFALFHLVAGAILLAVAEALHSTRRFRRFGVEEACAWIGVSYFTGGGLWLFNSLAEPGNRVLLGLGGWLVAGLAALAAWRWGTPWTGYVATAALFLALSQTPLNQLAWLVVALVSAWPLAYLSMAGHVSPEGRRRFREAFVVVTLAGYFALHVEVIERRLFAHLLATPPVAVLPPLPQWLLCASLVAMAVMPMIWLGVGLARRHRPAIDLGMFLLLISAVGLVDRLDLEPVWLALLVGGAALILAALALRAALGALPGAEWNGLTASALAEDRASAGNFETVAILAAFAPTARPLEEKRFTGEGGEFGGGGASAKF